MPWRKLCKGMQEPGREKSKLCIFWKADLSETYEGIVQTCSVFGRGVERQKLDPRFSGTVLSSRLHRHNWIVQAFQRDQS
jgi:hypothetical protein